MAIDHGHSFRLSLVFGYPGTSPGRNGESISNPIRQGAGDGGAGQTWRQEDNKLSVTFDGKSAANDIRAAP